MSPLSGVHRRSMRNGEKSDVGARLGGRLCARASERRRGGRVVSWVEGNVRRVDTDTGCAFKQQRIAPTLMNAYMYNTQFACSHTHARSRTCRTFPHKGHKLRHYYWLDGHGYVCEHMWLQA